jgi:hypothetical protein
MIPHRIERITISNNIISDTAAGSGNGWGIEVRSSADQGEVTSNTLQHNRAPQIQMNGTNYTVTGNTLVP